MRSSNHLKESLGHIVENADRVQRYIAGLNRETFEQNDAVRDAVERCIERVCEAAYCLGEQAETLMPRQPWGDIRGMGNRLRHAYDRINVDLLRKTAQSRVPNLAAEASRALAQCNEGASSARTAL